MILQAMKKHRLLPAECFLIGDGARDVEAAKKKGLKTIVSSGKDGGAIRGMADISLVIPSDVTARIQEMHMLCAHLICEIIDEESWGNE